MTLIEARKSDGTLIGRCDARCYDAKGPKCDCICSGANHGVGLRQAPEQQTERWTSVLEDLRHQYGEVDLRVSPEQLELELELELEPVKPVQGVAGVATVRVER